MKKIFKVTAVLLSGGVLLGAGLWTAFYLYNQPTGEVPSAGMVFRVEDGWSLTKVSYELEERDIIRSRYLLLGLSRVEDTGSKIKSGYYRIKPDMSTGDVHDLLVKGNQTLYKVSIPEGLTLSNTASILETKGICPTEEFLEETDSPQENSSLSEYPVPENIDSLEGFLFPDTYLFQRDFPARKVVTHMVDTFFEKLQKISPDYTEMAAEDLYEKIIIASIVEREYRNPEEADKIASVFYNRLERGMRLQSCATVVYVLKEQMGEEHPAKLTYDDLEVESEFNTYRRNGLPPAPIANPGEIALEAAFHPAETDYLFFLVKNPEAGEHTFSRTLSEHNEAYRLHIKQ